LINRFFDKLGREKNPSSAVVHGTHGQQIVAQSLRHLTDTQFLKQIEGSIIDAAQVGFAERLVHPTDLTRRAWIKNGLGCPLCQTPFAPTSLATLSSHSRSFETGCL
jgi:hypothetical protein